jgi:hypothetical protein
VRLTAKKPPESSLAQGFGWHIETAVHVLLFLPAIRLLQLGSIPRIAGRLNNKGNSTRSYMGAVANLKQSDPLVCRSAR